LIFLWNWKTQEDARAEMRGIPEAHCTSNDKAKSHLRRDRQIEIAGSNFYLESELRTAAAEYG
jgi:hypothetical protein